MLYVIYFGVVAVLFLDSNYLFFCILLIYLSIHSKAVKLIAQCTY